MERQIILTITLFFSTREKGGKRCLGCGSERTTLTVRLLKRYAERITPWGCGAGGKRYLSWLRAKLWLASNNRSCRFLFLLTPKNCFLGEQSEKYQRRLMLDVDRIKDCLAWGAEVTDPGIVKPCIPPTFPTLIRTAASRNTSL